MRVWAAARWRMRRSLEAFAGSKAPAACAVVGCCTCGRACPEMLPKPSASVWGWARDREKVSTDLLHLASDGVDSQSLFTACRARGLRCAWLSWKHGSVGLASVADDIVIHAMLVSELE